MPVRQDADATFMREYMATRITAQPDGAYSLKFLWKNRSLLTMPYVHAEPAQPLSKTLHLLQLYNTTITDQETRGFIERVDHHCEKAQFITSLLGTSPLPLPYVLYTIIAVNSHLSLQA